VRLATSLPDGTACRLGGCHQADKAFQPVSVPAKKPVLPANVVNVLPSISNIFG
jgi:hypothetical protein